jgi:glutathione S-transferase
VCEIWRDVRARFGEGGDLLFGSFTIADAFFAPVAWRFHSYAVPVGEVEQRYMQAIFALPEMREWSAAAERERAGAKA